MMKRQVLYGCALGLALSLPLVWPGTQLKPVAAQQLTAASSEGVSQIKGLRLVPQGEQLKLEVEITGGSRPQVFFTQQGRAWVGDITNVKLAVEPGQTSYRLDNPAPGIRSLKAQQISADSVRLEIEGTDSPPRGLLAERSSTQLVFDFETGSPSSQPQEGSPVAPAPAVVADGSNAPVGLTPAPAAPAAAAPQPPQPSAPENTVAQAPAASTAPAASPLTISQVPRVDQLDQPRGTSPAPSEFLNGAAAPPVGDIAIGTIVPQQPTIDLGSNSTITLTLKEAPVADVLTLLVRRAGLNVVLNEVGEDVTISLDVQDAPLQETFDFILRLKELQARRVEQTVFIGETLPGVTERVVRNFRLNQAEVQGGDQVDAGVLEFLEALAVEGGPLEGVQLIPDPRTNSISAIGTAQQMDIIAAQIAQLDIRKRQALVNVRVIDVNISENESLGVELGAAGGNFAFSGVPGDGGGDFGGTPLDQPAGSSVPNIGTAVGNQAFVYNTLNRLQQSLAVRLNAAIASGTGKILADPKVVVSDGGSSRVEIGNEVITNQTLQTDPATGASAIVFEKGIAGITLELNNVRIDDNGYISLDITPEVSAPAPAALQTVDFITLLNQRRLDTQRIRLQDGETFVLAGLIQDNDTVNVNAIPILSQLPLVGALFRDQTLTKTRTEVVVMVTPFVLQDDRAVSLAP